MMWVSIAALLLAALRLPTGSHQPVFEVVVCMSGLLAATQAVRAGWAAVPLAGLGLSHDVSDLVGCTEDPADTLDTIDNQSDAGKRLSVKLQSLAASRSHDMKIYTISGLVAAGLRPQQGL